MTLRWAGPAPSGALSSNSATQFNYLQLGYLNTTRTSATCFIDLRPWPGQASVEAPGLSLSFGCPRWSCGSHLACAARASPHSGERLKRGLLGSK